MSIEVSGPDGSSFEFPEGTSPDVVNAALAKHYGKASSKPTGERTVQEEAAFRRKIGGNNSFAGRAVQAATFNFKDELFAGAEAAGQTAYDLATGKGNTFDSRYDRSLAVQR
jgi:hypothetical protein